MTADSAVTAAEWRQLCSVMNGYVLSQTIVTACELNLFGFLERHSGADVRQVAEGLGLSVRATRVLLLASCTAGLIERDSGGRYANSPLASKVLVPGSPVSMVPFVLYNHHVQRPCISHLTASLREDRNAGLDEYPGDGETIYERLQAHPEAEQLFHRAMAAYTRLTAGSLDLFDFLRVHHLLDVGGGDASTAVRLCRRFPHLRVTTLDRPSVTRIARENVAREGLADRIACEALDIFDDPWPGGCDGILMSHVVEIFPPPHAQSLYRRAFEALPPGGVLFVWTLMSDDAETGGLQAAKSSAYFASTASGGGFAYPAYEHERWLAAAGFGRSRVLEAAAFDHGGIVAVKAPGGHDPC